MSDVPFGFGMPNEPDDESGRRGGGAGGSGGGAGGGGGGGGPQDPFGGMFDPNMMADMLRQFADMMSKQGDEPVNWDVAKNVARHAVSEHGDPSVSPAQRAQVESALRLADLWLDSATTLPSGVRTTEAWSRAEWVENTLPTWSKLCDPIAARVVESMGAGMPEEMRAVAGPLLGLVRQMGGMMVAQQSGQAVGALGREVVGSTDVGLPLGKPGTGVLIPSGVAEFGSGLEIPDDEVRLYLALREAAHQRLFVHVPWLRGHLMGAVADYARGIDFDTSRFEDLIGRVDINNPESLQQALSGSDALLEPQQTPQQKAALTRLETVLALVEGWVSVVVDEAVGGRLPHAAALAETMRRRRASGGPAETTFATLVGLELRPRRLREAAELWRELGAVRGPEGRDAVWNHPDLLPSADDLDDPAGFVRRQTDEDAAPLDISELEAGGSGEAPREDPGPDSGGERPDDR
ncbi:zinc-dependent metalloprotease [Allonocardiopsis opalescens]|uniref:Putative hydrolase n=1 Tax=Allonocardiopsis opalescens TaxID=1144618 RepID=A0A2T0QDM8_9ACTN|nr:zinc-dependent metalloprotease [Allonocardiopsis opalescens]PRY02029.1 putative hydrolase [Allonocardiopsis opalescens]